MYFSPYVDNELLHLYDTIINLIITIQDLHTYHIHHILHGIQKFGSTRNDVAQKQRWGIGIAFGIHFSFKRVSTSSVFDGKSQVVCGEMGGFLIPTLYQKQRNRCACQCKPFMIVTMGIERNLVKLIMKLRLQCCEGTTDFQRALLLITQFVHDYNDGPDGGECQPVSAGLIDE